MDDINLPKAGKGLSLPNVSVALCTCNGEAYIRETLQSISAQTQSPLELVAVDDKSSDNTVLILEEFRNIIDFPMHIHINDTQLGVNGNFEKVIQMCSGDYIFFADQDDIWMPQKIEDTLQVFHTNRCGAIFSNASRIDENDQVLRDDLWRSIPGQFTGYRDRVAFFKRLIKGNVVTGSTLAIQSGVIKHILPFPKTESFLYDAWIAMICAANPEIGITPLSRKLVHYRVHRDQYTARFRSVNNEASARDLQIKLFKLRGDHLEEVSRHLAHFTSADPKCLEILRQSIDFWQTRAWNLAHRTRETTMHCLRHLAHGSYAMCCERPLRNFMKDLFNLY